MKETRRRLLGAACQGIGRFVHFCHGWQMFWRINFLGSQNSQWGGRHTYTVWHSVSECLDSVEAKKNNPSFLFCNGRFSRAHGAIHSMCIIWDPVAIVSRLHVRYCPVYTARLGKPALHKMVNAVSHKSSVHSTRAGPQLLSINISNFSPNTDNRFQMIVVHLLIFSLPKSWLKVAVIRETHVQQPIYQMKSNYVLQRSSAGA